MSLQGIHRLMELMFAKRNKKRCLYRMSDLARFGAKKV